MFFPDEVRNNVFEALLLSLDSEPLKASEKYRNLHHKLVNFFLHSGVSVDAEELASEVVHRVAIRISRTKEDNEDNKIKDVFHYSLAVARNLLLEHRIKRKRQAEVSIEEFDLKLEDDNFQTKIILEDEFQIKKHCLLECLGKLKEEDKDLLLSYYQADKQERHQLRLNLADNHVSYNSLRVRVFRIRERLRRCIEQCISKDV